MKTFLSCSNVNDDMTISFESLGTCDFSAHALYEPPGVGSLQELIGDAQIPTWSIDSRESTPLVVASPKHHHDCKKAAIAARRDLSALIGEEAVIQMRMMFNDPLYWRTEALHLSHEWGVSKHMCAEDARQSIRNAQYWDFETSQYERCYRGAYSRKAKRHASKSKKQAKAGRSQSNNVAVELRRSERLKSRRSG